jgi:hypothetical protein
MLFELCHFLDEMARRKMSIVGTEHWAQEA